MHLVITGGSGYIGRAVVAQALRDGHRVTMLGARRPPAAGLRSVPWRLGEPVPAETWAEPVDAVIHLAHAWHDTAAEADDPNVRGSELLITAARAAGVKRFVFASSLSARPDARNRYGRVKHRIERMLRAPAEVSARVGLVYGGPAQSLWGVLRRVAGLPLLPVPARRHLVHPIHVSDVATGLLTLASAPTVPDRVVLATDPPIAFGQFLQEVARRVHGRRLLLVDLPERPLLFLLDALVKLGLPLNPLRERVLGLVGLTVQPAAADAPSLRLTALTLQQGLDRERPRPRHARAGEAFALLRYVLGTAPSTTSLRRYLRGWQRLDFGAPLLPPLLRRCPGLLRLFEPLPGDRRQRASALRMRLAAAAFLADTEVKSARRVYAYAPAGRLLAWTRLLAAGVLEALLLPPRSLLSYWMWR